MRRYRLLLALSLASAGCAPDLGDFGPTGPVPLAIMPGAAATGGGAPSYNSILKYTTTLTTSGDPADFYYPGDAPAAATQALPIALFLQGANADKSQYSKFAATVASYGFVVVIPNHAGLFGLGLFSQVEQIDPILAFLGQAHDGPDAALNNIADIGKLVIIGHSYGGAVALTAVQGLCIPPFCSAGFIRPAALKGIAVYGSFLADPPYFGQPSIVGNDSLPILVISGMQDGISNNAKEMQTFNLIRDPVKALLRVSGANHFAIANENGSPGVTADPNIQSLSQEASTETIGRWCALFLQGYALNNAAARQYLKNEGPILDGNISLQITE